MSSSLPKYLSLVVVLAGLGGCWNRSAVQEPLTIDRTSPVLSDSARPVLLNDALTVYFSQPIQPGSVNEDSVVLLDQDGHQVDGAVEVGSNWITFVPAPPLARNLEDGTFRPGGQYRLHLTGKPRFARIRAEGGGSMDETVSFDVYVARLDQAPEGLPTILRPLASDLPWMMRTSDVPQYIAADAPKLQLHFTMPVLPTSVRPEAFRVRLLDPAVVLVPRSVRVVASPLDEHRGSSVEIDLGAIPESVDGRQIRLGKGDFISVELLASGGLHDYSGRPPLIAGTQFWSVVEGTSLPICEWPSGSTSYAPDRDLQPGFEVSGSTIRPRVRVEAGNGNLGVFRPGADLTIRPGQPFDRGDGVQVVSVGSDFPFAAIDVPAGVTVTVDATDGPVRLLATGGIRVAGDVRLLGQPRPLPPRYTVYPVQELIEDAGVCLVAAGSVQLLGQIESEASVVEGSSALLIAFAGTLDLQGSVPFQTILVPDAHDGGLESQIEGVRGQSLLYQGRFTPGLAVGAELEVVGLLPWRQLPAHLASGLLEVAGRRGDVSIAWQSTSADAIRGEVPDMSPGRVSRWQSVRDRDLLGVGAGGFVRLKISARVRHGGDLPSVSSIRIVEN